MTGIKVLALNETQIFLMLEALYAYASAIDGDIASINNNEHATLDDQSFSPGEATQDLLEHNTKILDELIFTLEH